MQTKTGSRIWRRFCRNRDGVALVEFAMAVPVMVLAYLGTVEVAQVVMINRKVTQLTSALGDLTARVQAVTPADVENIFNASETVLMPYDATNAGMVIASIVTDSAGVARVCWSNQRRGVAPARGSTITIPDTYRVPNTSVIMARATYVYKPSIGYQITEPFKVGDNPIYLRPRNGLASGSSSIEQVVRTGTNPCPNFS